LSFSSLKEQLIVLLEPTLYTFQASLDA